MHGNLEKKCTKIYNNHHDYATLTISCGSKRTRVEKHYQVCEAANRSLLNL